MDIKTKDNLSDYNHKDLFAIAPRILLVEDNHLSQRIITALLQEFGCTVDLAKTGAEALKMFMTGYDAIFLDLGLPDISGITIARAIRSEENINKLRGNVILALTACGNSIADSCYAAGFNDFYTKPVQYDQLKWAFLKWLPNHCKNSPFSVSKQRCEHE